MLRTRTYTNTTPPTLLSPLNALWCFPRACLQVKEICTHDDSLNEYTELFAQGYKTVDEVEAEFAAAFGESFQYLDPVRMHATPRIHPYT